MHEFFNVAVFWIVVFAGICIIARFPESWLGRMLFTRLGPLPVRGETRSRYLLRWAIYCASWFVQAVLVLGLGAFALELQPWLAESLYFLVFWAIVVPLVAIVALTASLVAMAGALWRRHLGAERRVAVRI